MHSYADPAGSEALEAAHLGEAVQYQPRGEGGSALRSHMSESSREPSAPTRVPTLLDRERIPQAAIDEVVRQIVAGFHPQRIILFGSYARGEPRPTSDVDLMVVMETPLREAEQAARICQAIEYHFGLDLQVRTPQTLARRLVLADPFLTEVVTTGTVLYERPDR